MRISFTCLFLLAILTGACSYTRPSNERDFQHEPVGKYNRAYQLGKLTLECTANDTERFNPRPTVTSRILALTWTAIFDAWSRYDDHAMPFYIDSVERRPPAERTLENKEIAITYAAYRTMLAYYFKDSLLLRKQMLNFGLDPDDDTSDPASPVGIGNLAAKSVIEARLNDGSNQLGNVPASNGVPYSDYTGYTPVNHPDNLTDLSKWQPKYFSDGRGGKFAPGCLTPHWWKVKPLILDSAAQFRPPPPPAIGSPQLAREVREVVELQAGLTNEQKALVEFMRDGPKSVQQAGHWLIFAQSVSRRDNHSLDEDVNMYFALEAAAMDAFISVWDAKMWYDYARPYSLVHEIYREELVNAWGGPGKGTVTMPGKEWRPYSPETFLCPPFPGYVSGHSAVSAACAEILRRFTSSDHFGEEVRLVPGLMTEPDNVADTVTLHFPTFTETAEMAGFSRVLGGYHIQADNIEGLALGRKVAGAVWAKYLQHRGKGEPVNVRRKPITK